MAMRRWIGREPACRGFTLVELLTVVAIIAVLAALLLGAAGVLRERSDRGRARSVVANLVAGVLQYAAEDDRRRHPMQDLLFGPAAPHAYLTVGLAPHGGYPEGLIGLLEDRKLYSRSDADRFIAGELHDPWDRPYLYRLTRPSPSTGAARLADWNWDPGATHAPQVRAWDAAAGAPTPFPYIYSLGRSGDHEDPATWIYLADGT